MNELLKRITVVPDICNGKPTIRGMRITAQTVLEYLLAGDTPEEIIEEYPFLEMEDIEACRAFALQMFKHEITLLPLSA